MRVSGIVTHRQQPSAASGVSFAMLEDEVGTVHIIVWPSVPAAQRQALRRLDANEGPGHVAGRERLYSLVAHRLVNPDKLLGRLRATSRIFR